MATKYEVLEALVDATTSLQGDPNGNGDVVAGVVRIIGETHGSEELLSDVVYDFIAGCFIPPAEGRPRGAG